MKKNIFTQEEDKSIEKKTIKNEDSIIDNAFSKEEDKLILELASKHPL